MKIIVGILPGTEETAMDLKAVLKCRFVLVSSTRKEVNDLSQYLKRRLEAEVDEIWSVGSDVQNHNAKIFQNIKQKGISKEGNPTKWARELSKHIQENLHLLQSNSPTHRLANISGMILILLYRFSESHETLLGYQLCLKLVKEGHHLYVTTTSTGGWLKAEIQKAEQLTEDSDGSITLLTPQCRDYEQPSPEWIANFHKQYFGYLCEHTEINGIVGILPGTAQTAVELKEILKCTLVLLATTKIGGGKGELTNEINRLVQRADEVWSVGSDIYTHYQYIFQEKSIIPNETHKEILFQPNTGSAPFWERHSTGRKITSVFRSPTFFFHNGRKEHSNGSNPQCFRTFSAALSEINANAKRHMDILQWNLHGLQYGDQIEQHIQGRVKPDVVKITPLSTVTSIDHIPLKNCRAFVVPDYVEESFNFLALSAMWLGIPTLVSSQSSVGKFLLSLPYQEKSRAVVNLTGDYQHDKQQWIEKIRGEIIDETSSKRWARGLSEYLQANRQIWEIDLFLFPDSFSKRRRTSDASQLSFTTVAEGVRDPDIVAKVEKWKISLPQQVRAMNLEGISHPFDSGNVTPSSSQSSLSSDHHPTSFSECAKHKGYVVDLYCQTCGQLIGQACHPWHKTHSILFYKQNRKTLSPF